MIFFLSEIIKTWFEHLMVCRTVTIFYSRKDVSWVDLPDILNMFVKSAENFLRSILEKSFCSKHEVLPEYSFLILTFILKRNINSFHFLWHIIWSVRRVVTPFLLTQRVGLGAPSKYFELVREVHRKVLYRPLENILISKHEDLTKHPNPTMSFILSTSQLFSLFLTYYLIEGSCH